jgi:hypothetical protein
MTYEHLPALRALRAPALFLFGAGDRLIPIQKSVDLIRLSQGTVDSFNTSSTGGCRNSS